MIFYDDYGPNFKYFIICCIMVAFFSLKKNPYFLINSIFLSVILFAPFPTSLQAEITEPNQPNFIESIPSVKLSILGPQLPLTNDAKGEFTIRVSVPKDHHAYLNSGNREVFIPLSFDFSGVESSGYKVENISSPKGVYDKEFEAIVLRGEGEFKFSIHRVKGLEFIIPPIKVKSQICNDITKICFLPHIEEIPLVIKGIPKENAKGGIIKPSFPSPQNILTKNPLPQSEGDGFTGKISFLYSKYSQNFLLAFILIFFSGILAAGTPCVYPMIPITSAIIMKRGGSNKQLGIFHSIIYFLGIVLIFITLGYIAGMTGGAFNTIMQSYFFNLLFAFLFGFLGLAMLGLFDFTIGEGFTSQISSAVGNRGGMIGTFLMGMTAGLIISPCVGPIVFALLLQVADRIAEANATITELRGEIPFLKKSILAAEGGLMMGAFGIGIGIPFLLVGILSNHIPKAGRWMEYIKFALGFGILYIAWIYYMKGIKASPINDQAGYTLLTGLVAIFFSIYLGLLRPEKNRIKKSVSFFLLLPAFYFMYDGLSQTEIITRKEISPTSTVIRQGIPKIEKHGNLEWYRDFEEAKRIALKKNKPIFIDFFAYWCANCLEFEKLSLKNEKLNQSLNNAILVKIYDTDPIFKEFRENPLHRELKIGLPYYTILKPNGEFFWKGTQYNAVEKMKTMIKAASVT